MNILSIFKRKSIEADRFDRTVKHCPKCGRAWVFAHNFCLPTKRKKNNQKIRECHACNETVNQIMIILEDGICQKCGKLIPKNERFRCE